MSAIPHTHSNLQRTPKLLSHTRAGSHSPLGHWWSSFWSCSQMSGVWLVGNLDHQAPHTRIRHCGTLSDFSVCQDWVFKWKGSGATAPLLSNFQTNRGQMTWHWGMDLACGPGVDHPYAKQTDTWKLSNQIWCLLKSLVQLWNALGKYDLSSKGPPCRYWF